MDHAEQYIGINRRLWDERTPHHMASSFYDLPGFVAGRNTLNEIELALLSDVRGKKILHLQCHFGQDSLSLARMGAEVTGADFSEKAIEAACSIAADTGIDARFICSDVYALPEMLQETFDIVFTSYGVIGWLPDMKRWAETVSHFLKPGGVFVLVEFHPAVWMFDNDFTRVKYAYFNTQPIVEEEQGTYADKRAPVQAASVSWNHPLSDVLQGLLDSGLELERFQEFDYSPYNCLGDMVEADRGKFRIRTMEGKLPLVYALSMVRR